MSAFDEVLAENWIVDEFGEVMATADGDQRAPRLNVMQDGRRGQVVGAVCVLGKRALELLLLPSATVLQRLELANIRAEVEKLREGT